MSSEQPSVPNGYCECGCGGKTELATRAQDGYVVGQPRRFIAGHNRRRCVTGGGGHRYGVATTFSSWPIEVATDGCHIWQAAKTTAGYGEVWDGQVRYAHRVAYERAYGSIPDGLLIDHLCRNRACVNPQHLEAVTCAENLRRGRGTKLTAEDVVMIRKLAANGTPVKVVHAQFPAVAASTISNIICRRTWVDIP